jgi:uncharacterized membrane protein
MTGGIATVAVFTLVAVIITLIGVLLGHPILGTIGMINALLGVLIGLPLLTVGKTRMHQAVRLLSSSSDNRALDAQQRNEAIASDPQSDFQTTCPRFRH